MSIEKILYQARAKATGGGRDEGRTVSSDGALDVHLSRPREMGGPAVQAPILSNFSPQVTRRASCLP